MRAWLWFFSLGFLVRGLVARPSGLCLLIFVASNKDAKKLLIGNAGTKSLRMGDVFTGLLFLKNAMQPCIRVYIYYIC